MKLPADAAIAREKIVHYLLVRQSRGDKSAFLERAGYTHENPNVLIASLEAIRDEGEARWLNENKFGRYFVVEGFLYGPSGVVLQVRTIWMTETLSGVTKLVTLIPIKAIDR